MLAEDLKCEDICSLLAIADKYEVEK